jgi:hypothetical protein
VRFLKKISNPGAEQPAEEQPDGEVLDGFLAHALAFGPAAGQPGTQDECQEEHHAKAEDRDAVRKPAQGVDRDTEEDLPHDPSGENPKSDARNPKQVRITKTRG